MILRYDRLGDMVVTTPVFRLIKQRYPHLRVGVFASPLNEQIIRFNPWIDAVYVLHKEWLPLVREIWRARKDGYDVVLNFIFNRTTSAGILANLISPGGVKIGQGDEKYGFYFNSMLQLARSQQHMTETLVSILDDVLGHSAGQEDDAYEIVVDDRSREDVGQFLTGGSFVVHNISATGIDRQLSADQSRAIIRHLLAKPDRRVVVIFGPSDASRAAEIANQFPSDRCMLFAAFGQTPMLQIASLLEASSAVITPDTGIIHIASAMKTPVLGFFNEIEMPHEWSPRGVFHRNVVSPGRTPVSHIPIQRIQHEIDEFFAELPR